MNVHISKATCFEIKSPVITNMEGTGPCDWTYDCATWDKPDVPTDHVSTYSARVLGSTRLLLFCVKNPALFLFVCSLLGFFVVVVFFFPLTKSG